jgi:hypothetical protein
MKTRKYGYVIRNIYNNEFWSEKYHTFKGLLYATFYKNKREARNNSIDSSDLFEIIKVYKRS